MKMNRLIRLQLRNMFHNKLLYICLGINILLSGVLLFVVSLTMKNITNTSYAVCPQIISFLSGEPGLVSMMFIAIFACLDFNEGTTKNIIARGYTRTQLLISKIITTLIGVAVMAVVTCIIIFALFIKDGLGFNPDMIWTLIVSLFTITAETVFLTTVSFILEKNSAAIIGCIFVPRLLDMLFTVVQTQTKIDLGKYWISNLMSNFSSNPSPANMILPIILSVGYIVLFICAGTQIMYKKEIK